MLNLRFETWSVTFPEEWDHGIEDDVLAIATPAGGSVLQIGSMSKEDGAVTDQDLWEFMNDAGVDTAEIQRTRKGDFEGLSAEAESDTGMIRYWILRAGGTLLLATFQTPLDKPDADLDGVNGVLDSLRLEDPLPERTH
jgi:hypothetical protein